MRKILLIDDEADVQEVLAMIIEDELEVEIDKSSSVTEALTKIDSENEYNIIISDYRMPDGSGLDIYNKSKGIPFIILSGIELKNLDVADKFHKDPNCVSLCKPIDEDILISSIKKLMK